MLKGYATGIMHPVSDSTTRPLIAFAGHVHVRHRENAIHDATLPKVTSRGTHCVPKLDYDFHAL